MSRPVFSFRPNLKNPEHEKAWQLLMEIPAGQRNQYLVDVILEQEERETLKRLIQEAVREELKCGDVERMPAQEKEEIPGQMLDFLSECIRYGISVCVAGATSSGKTTLLGWLLTTIPDGKRIYSIENGSRELALVRRKDGRVVNSVIHTLTRDSENERQRVDQIALLDMALRFNPDIIVVGEMRGPEANAAQEAARTGVAVVTTIHSMSCEATYRRMVSLCKRAVDMSDETLMGFVTEAYPIIAFCKQLENKERRLMEIMECEITADGKRKFNPLYRYEITENRMEGDRFIINGTHKKVCGISESLKKRFLENGMPKDVLERIEKGGKKVC